MYKAIIASVLALGANAARQDLNFDNMNADQADNGGVEDQPGDVVPTYDNAPADRLDAAIDVVGQSAGITSPLEARDTRDNTVLKIQNVIRLYQMSKQMYDAAIQAHLDAIYNQYDSPESDGMLNKDQALEFLYDVLDVKRQHKELALARVAADIANGEDEFIDKNEMEQFLYNLVTEQYADMDYQNAEVLGINI